MASSSSAGGVTQLPINLYTRNPSHSIPQSTYFIPADWKRFQLSELINKVLQSTSALESPIPFDFLIDDTLLRTSLEDFVNAHRNGDKESTLNVEYLESLQPPKKLASYPQDDWVSGVNIQRTGYVLMSSYLSHLRVLPLADSEASKDALYTLPLPSTLGATCCSWLSPPEQGRDILVGAGGMDRRAHVFSLPSLDAPAGEEAREIMTLQLHTGPISSITPSRDYSRVLTSSWDGQLGVFALPTASNPLEESHDVPAEPTSYLPGQNKKRRKTAAQQEGAAAEGSGGGWRKQPEMVMRGHEARIGGAIWDKAGGNAGRVWSAGWDGSVRGWDAESGYQAELKQGPADRAALCIDQFSANGTLVTGNMDRTVCLWDTRESASSLVSLTLQTTSPVPSVRCHPTSAYSLATATYSGALQIWDVRSPKQALFTVANTVKQGVAGGRLLSLDWNGELMAAGGEDGEVGVWTARGQ